MNTNEPFLISAKCEINKETYYWGYSTNCTGWVNAKNVALCKTIDEWKSYWKVSTNAQNFVTVVGSRIILENSSSQSVKLMSGTVLKLVPEGEIPSDLISKKATNYIVYFASRDVDGNAKKTYAVLDKNLELYKGYMKLTQSNILDVAFSCIGDEYGWGGMNGNMDCSLYTRSIYKCFGLELPRNTTWQQKVPEKYTDVSKMGNDEKKQLISTLPAGSLLYFNGHTMAYLGIDKDKNFVVSDLGTVIDEVGDPKVVTDVHAVTVNSLDVRRSDGFTWLKHIEGVISFLDPINLTECDVKVENEKVVYDGTEKMPSVEVTYEGKSMYEGVNYEVEFFNNTEVGIATIEILGLNNFKGKVIKNFVIEKAPEKEDDSKDQGNSSEGTNTDKESDSNKGESTNNEGSSEESKKPEKTEPNIDKKPNDFNVKNPANQEQKEEDNNKIPVEIELKDDSVANLKLPFAGVKDYGYFSTPYFRWNLVAILILIIIYRLVYRKENT